MASRLDRLKQLQDRIPVANEKLATQQRAARDIQLQQAVSGAGPGAGVRAAQAVGTQMATAAGQQQVARQAGAQQMTGQVAQAALGEQQRGAAEAVGRQQTSTQRTQLSGEQRLAALDQRVKNQLLDQQLQFRKDESGRTLLNERQLLDYAAANARSDQDLQNYQADLQRASDRKLKLLEMAYKKITQELEQESLGRRKKLDQETKKYLAQKKMDIERAFADEQKRRNKRNGMITALGTVIGAGIGTAIAPGYGTVAGAQIGGGLASSAASATS